jgi:hypothetical protein
VVEDFQAKNEAQVVFHHSIEYNKAIFSATCGMFSFRAAKKKVCVKNKKRL